MTKTLYQRYRYDGKFPFMMFNSNKVAQAMFDGTAAEEIVEPSPVIDYSREYFTVTSWQDNNTIYFKRGYRASNQGVDMWISYDKETWTNFTTSMTTSGIYSFALNKGQKAYFRGNNNSLCFSTATNPSFPSTETNFHASKYFEVSGNIMSLLWGSDFIGKTTLPDSSATRIFQNMFETVFYTSYNYILSARNLVIPLTQITTSCLESMFYDCSKLRYTPKELPDMTIISSGSNDGNIAMFNHGCSSLFETPVFRQKTGGGNNIYKNICAGMSNIKRSIFLCDTGYPSTANNATVKYKSSTNTTVSGSAYRDFDTLQAQNAFLSIWAETENEYDGIVGGCSDYFIAGDSVTLTYVAVNATFAGYYDENDNLLSSSSTYTFTAQRSMKIKVKTT